MAHELHDTAKAIVVSDQIAASVEIADGRLTAKREREGAAKKSAKEGKLIDTFTARIEGEVLKGEARIPSGARVFVHGAPQWRTQPFAEPQSAHSVLWVEDAPPRPLDHLSLAALCDVFFVRVFQVRGTVVPAGTVTMTVHFHANADDLAAQGSRPEASPSWPALAALAARRGRRTAHDRKWCTGDKRVIGAPDCRD